MGCTSNGVENSEDVVVCGDCAQSGAAEPPCRSCGRFNPSALRFCHGWGARLAQRTPPTSTYTREPLAAVRSCGRYAVKSSLGMEV